MGTPEGHQDLRRVSDPDDLDAAHGYQQARELVLGRPNSQSQIILRLVGSVGFGASQARGAWSEHTAAGRRHAVAEGLASGLGGLWNGWLLWRSRSAESWDAIRTDRTLFVVDVAVSTLLTLMVALGVPRGRVAGGSGVNFQSAIAAGFMWTAAQGVGAGTAAATAGAVLTPGLARLNRSGVGPEAMLHPVWGFLGVLVVGMTRTLQDALVERGGIGAQLERRVAVSDVVHNTALHAIDAALDDPDLPIGAAKILSQARIRLRAFLDNPTAGQGNRSLTDALAQRLAQLDTGGVDVDLICHVEQAPAPVVAVIVTATAAAVDNTAEHSEDDVVTVTVRHLRDGRLRVAIRDDGVGFQASRALPGYGLEGAIRRPVEDVGGRVHVLSHPEVEGTLVQLSFDSEVLEMHR